VKVSLILLIALGACAVLRHRSAALRHWVLAAAVTVACAMPLLERIVPSGALVLSAPAMLQRMTIEGRDAQRGPSGEHVNEVRSANPHVLPAHKAAGAPVPRALWWGWIIGALCNALVVIVGLVRLEWVASHATPIARGEWADAAAKIARENDVGRPITLLGGTRPGLLVTWGALGPKILIPSSALGWNAARIDVVLRHEIAHIRRHDWAAQLMSEMLRSLYWFNPLAWIVCRRLRHESERAADDAVLLRGIKASEYAAHLLDLARTMTHERRSWAAAPAMARPSSLERRIRAMLNTHVDRRPLSRVARLGCGAAAIMLAAAVASLAFAQAGSARFAGSVSDPTGAPLPDTTISLTHRQSNVTHAVPTDEAGAFAFATLPPGDYLFEARATGFAAVKSTITLEAGQAAQRDIRLDLGSVQETITVAASDASANTRPPKTAAEVASLLERLRGTRLQPPIKMNHVRPTYPAALRDAGIEGQVVLTGRIATDGSVAALDVGTPAHADLVSAALEAARQWRFEPTRLWGAPVEVPITMTFNFRRQP
jgi:TonB family protein